MRVAALFALAILASACGEDKTCLKGSAANALDVCFDRHDCILIGTDLRLRYLRGVDGCDPEAELTCDETIANLVVNLDSTPLGGGLELPLDPDNVTLTSATVAPSAFPAIREGLLSVDSGGEAGSKLEGDWGVTFDTGTTLRGDFGCTLEQSGE